MIRYLTTLFQDRRGFAPVRGSLLNKAAHGVFIALCVFPTGRCLAESPLMQAVPADAVFALIGEPIVGLAAERTETQPADETGDNGSQIPAILAFLNAAGLIPDQGQVFTDIASCLPLLGRHEYALILLDVNARTVKKPGATSRPSIRLESMRAAIVFRTGNHPNDAVALLDRVVGRYTNNKVGKLTTRSVGKDTCQRLTDSRVPAWAVWDWGQLDDLFVLTLGQGAFDVIARTYRGSAARLADDRWYRRASAALGHDPIAVQWTFDFARLESRLGPQEAVRVHSILEALDAEGIDRDLWRIGLNGRELTCRRCFRCNGKDQVQTLAGDEATTRRHAPIIPPQARHFAVLNVEARWLVENVPNAVVSGRSDSTATAMRSFWARTESEIGMDIDGQIVANLEDELVIFDYPPHPLGIPLAVTLAVPIRNGREVQTAVDAAFRAWSRRMEARPSQPLFRIGVFKSEDGIWYLQAGLLGPALKVTEHYLVVSWSPRALREALAYIEPRGR